MSTIYVIEAIVAFAIALWVLVRVAGVVRGRLLARDERQRRLLEEAWAIHVASRRIHDQASAAFLAMMDIAREKKQPGSEKR